MVVAVMLCVWSGLDVCVERGLVYDRQTAVQCCCVDEN